MAEHSNNRDALEILLATLQDNPDLWETRKKTAKLLYEDKKYLEAADILWGAPEIPATDIDVAFALQVISRVKPNRSIRLIYEVLRRNKGKPLKNMAVAKALNNVGLYMEAARFYGAAIAEESKVFNLAFERQMLWMDDSKRLIEEWMKSDQESKLPLNVSNQDLSGGMIRPTGIHNEIDSILEGVSNPRPDETHENPDAPIATQPLVVPSSIPQPVVEGVESALAGQAEPKQSVDAPAAKTAKPNPFLIPGAEASTPKVALNTGMGASAFLQGGGTQPQSQQNANPVERITRPLLVAGAQENVPEAPKTRSLIGESQIPQQGLPAANQQPTQVAPPVLRRPTAQQVVPQQQVPVQQAQVPLHTQVPAMVGVATQGYPANMMQPGMQMPAQPLVPGMPVPTQPVMPTVLNGVPAQMTAPHSLMTPQQHIVPGVAVPQQVPYPPQHK